MAARIIDFDTAAAEIRRRRAADPFGILGFWAGYAGAVLELQCAALSLWLVPMVRR